MTSNKHKKAFYHLPGLFEFFELYQMFLPLYHEHRAWFYEWCEIGSIYGAPADCLWGGGRVGFGDADAQEVLILLNQYNISARLTFSNSLITEEHLQDKRCNKLCSLFSEAKVKSGVIVYSDLLLDYVSKYYPNMYFVASTTKVLTDFNQLVDELDRKEFSYVVPDFRLNKSFDKLNSLSEEQKSKIEFLCNECCSVSCTERRKCYETVSRKSLGEACPEHVCKSSGASVGYRFSKAMESPVFIGLEDIRNVYLPKGFSNYKLEGRGLGSAVVLELLLYYMVKPEYQLKVREEIYLDSMLDLF